VLRFATTQAGVVAQEAIERRIPQRCSPQFFDFDTTSESEVAEPSEYLSRRGVVKGEDVGGGANGQVSEGSGRAGPSRGLDVFASRSIHRQFQVFGLLMLRQLTISEVMVSGEAIQT
jgi:hypothetical protein